jgi:hypothetical protein
MIKDSQVQQCSRFIAAQAGIQSHWLRWINVLRWVPAFAETNGQCAA